ncbi:two pore potassium channel c-like [Curcuma longa]|uniref:two pore potassium channel c-like n=1 Tax=Curcuma longa TaxID=136217 RepID=UPI003D9F4EC7
METEPLLSIRTGSPSQPPPASPPVHRRRPSVTSSTPRSSALCPLPEDGEITIPISTPTTATASSLKDLLVFGHLAAASDQQTDGSSSDNPNPNPSSSDHWKINLHRSRTAPAMSVINDVVPSHTHSPDRPPIIMQAFLLLLAYLAFGVAVYTFNHHHFQGTETHPVVDALYFCIVTMCTIGYGDITPSTAFAKIFCVLFVIIGFGFVDILLSGTVSYVLDVQESLILSALNKIDDKKYTHQEESQHGRSIAQNYIIDVKKGRMRIRMKVALALFVVLLCVSLGTGVLRFVERLGWLDSFYLSVMSVTTVGYGDRAFKTLPGRLFASLWLLVSTLAVARAFLYLAEARIHKRHRSIAQWVLSRDMTVSEFLAADMDNDGFVTKSEFVIYKLKEMEKVSDNDIKLICNQFDKLDVGNCGKITLRSPWDSSLS